MGNYRHTKADEASAKSLVILAGLELLLGLAPLIAKDEQYGFAFDVMAMFGGMAALTACAGFALAKGNRKVVILVGLLQFAVSVPFLVPSGRGLGSGIALPALPIGFYLLGRAAGLFQGRE